MEAFQRHIRALVSLQTFELENFIPPSRSRGSMINRIYFEPIGSFLSASPATAMQIWRAIIAKETKNAKK